MFVNGIETGIYELKIGDFGVHSDRGDSLTTKYKWLQLNSSLLQYMFFSAGNEIFRSGFGHHKD